MRQGKSGVISSVVSFRRHARHWGAYLAGGGLVLVVALLSGQLKKKGSDSEADGQHTERPTLEAIASALHRAEKRYLSEHKHQDGPSGLANKLKAAVGRITTSEWLMVVFTAVIAGVGVVGAVIANGQLGAMRGQLDEMRDEQRPFVFIKSIAISNVRIEAKALFATFDYTLVNSGHLPAIAAIGQIEANPFLPGLLSKYADLEKRACMNMPGLGETILPGEDPVSFSANALLAYVQDAKSAGVLPLVAACVSYKDPAGRYHHTPYFYDVMVARNGSPCCMVPIDPIALSKSVVTIPRDLLGSINPD